MPRRKAGADLQALNERERRFVDAYMGEAAGNATKAAVLAGYSAKTAGSMASRLLKKLKIQTALSHRAEQDPLVATREERQHFWTSVMHGHGKFAKVPWKDRLKASELLGRTQGDFIDRHEVTGKDGAPIPVNFYLPANGRDAEPTP